MAEADVFDIEIQNNDTTNSNQKTNSDSDEEPLEIQEVKHISMYSSTYRSTSAKKSKQYTYLFSQQFFSHLIVQIIALYENSYNFLLFCLI